MKPFWRLLKIKKDNEYYRARMQLIQAKKLIYDNEFQYLGFCENVFQIIFEYLCVFRIVIEIPFLQSVIVDTNSDDHDFEIDQNYMFKRQVHIFSTIHAYNISFRCYFNSHWNTWDFIGGLIMKTNIYFEKETNLLDLRKFFGNTFNMFNWLHYTHLVCSDSTNYFKSLNLFDRK